MPATWALHAHETHIAAGDLFVCRPSSCCRMFRLGWEEEGGGADRGRIEGGMEKYASLNKHTIETSMYGCQHQQ